MARVRHEPPAPVRVQVGAGLAELLPDADDPEARWLVVDGVPQSHVDLGDPTQLSFEYVRLLGDVVDVRPPGPLRVLHLGGGACTLPRYVAATRPGSTQLVLEVDAGLVALVREHLGVQGFALKVADALATVPRLADASSELVVADLFHGATLPAAVTTTAWAAEVRRVVAPGGAYAVNLADGPGLAFVRRQVTTLRTAFEHLVLLAEPGVLRGRRFGNVVLASSDLPWDLATLRRRAARAAGTARVVAGSELDALAGDARPVEPGDPVVVPVPPPEVFVTGRR